MKKFKLKAIAVALLASMTVSAAILPSKAAKVGEGIDVPNSGVVTYDFNSSENPLEEHLTGTYDKSANGTSGIVLSENETVFKIGFGSENIYTPVNWDTDLVRKSMSLRINNQGITGVGDKTFQRIILWYQDANNWLGLDWKISDDKKTYDTRISGKNSSLSRVSGSEADPSVLFGWKDLSNSGKMPIGENDGWIQFNAEYTDVNTIKLSWYKESAPETVYKATLNSTFNFEKAYDITSATTGTVNSSSYFTKYDWRTGLFGIAGTGNYYSASSNTIASPVVGYYDDLSVTLDVEPAEVRNFKKTYADTLALDADTLYAKFSTDYAAFTADIANVDKAFSAFSALSDSSKEKLTSEKAALEKLIGTKKKAEAYLGNDINVDFEDGLSAETSIEMNTAFGSTSNRELLTVIDNPFKTAGNTSDKVVQLARDGETGKSNMIHKIKYTDADSSNAIANVSFKMYFKAYKGNGQGARVYFNYDDTKEIDTQDYISFYADGANEPLQFVYKKYDTAAANYTDSYSSAIKTADGTANLGTMAGQWYTVNIAYTDTGFSVTLTTADGVTSRVVSKPAENTLSANAFAIGMTQFASDSYYDDFKVTFRTPYDITMTEGAWLRNTANSGMRFGAQEITANELYNKNDCTVAASGALFMPENGLEDGELLTVERTKTANSKNYKARGSEKTETAMPENVYGVLTNVIDNDKFDVKQQLVCRVYIKYTKAGDPTGTYRYAYAPSNSVSRSLSDIVISAAKQHADYTGSAYTEALTALKNAGYLAGGNQ